MQESIAMDAGPEKKALDAARDLVQEQEAHEELRRLAKVAMKGASDMGDPAGDFLPAATLVYLAARDLPDEYLAGAHVMVHREAMDHLRSFGEVEMELDKFAEAIRHFIERRKDGLVFNDGSWTRRLENGVLRKLDHDWLAGLVSTPQECR